MKIIFILLFILLILLFFVNPIIRYFKKVKDLQNEKIKIETNDLRISSIIYKYIFIDFNTDNYTLCKIFKTEKNEIVISFRYDYPKIYKNSLCLFNSKPKNEIYNFQIVKSDLTKNTLSISIKNYLFTSYNLSININDESDYNKIKEILNID